MTTAPDPIQPNPSMRATTRRALKTFGMLVAVSSVTLAAMEGVVRVWGYSQRHIYDPIYTAYDGSPEIPYVHKPNLVRARARGLAIIDTDRLGLRTLDRDGPAIKAPGEYRIAVMGDSLTFGEGVVRTEDTFTQVLERSLNLRQRNVSVKAFNFGVSSYSVKEIAATLEFRAPEIQPDLALMAIIPGDFDLSRTPAVNSSGYLVDRRFAVVAAPDSRLRDALRGLHLSYVLREAWAYVFPRPGGTPAASGPTGESHDYRYVRRFEDLARRRGIPYVVVLLPRSPWGTTSQELSLGGVRHADLSFIRSEFTTAQYMASPFDAHPSWQVHRRIGEALADYLLQQPDLLRSAVTPPLR